MKKLTLLIILVFSLQFLFSQTVLNSSNNLTLGDTFRVDSYTEVSSIDPGCNGANCTWDYSTITGGNYVMGEGVVCVSPSTTLFADSSVTASADICIRRIDNPTEGFFHYHKYNNTSDHLIAFGLYSSGSGSFCTYYDELTTLEYPFSYGESFDDTWELLMFSFDMGCYYSRDSSIVTVEADAYGTIITPAGEFQNVLRVKRTTIDYSWSNYGGTEWISLGSFTDTQYDWYAPDIKTPVMSMFEAEWLPDMINVSYLVEYDFSTGVEEQTVPHLQIFPNPAQDRVSIITDRRFSSIKVISLNGQEMGTIVNFAKQYTLDISNYSKGVYLFEIAFEDGSVQRERIVKF